MTTATSTASTTKTTSAETRIAGMTTVLNSMPRRLRGTPVKGRGGLDVPNLAITNTKDGKPLNVQVKVLQKGNRPSANVTKYMDVDSAGVVTGLKDANRDLIVVIAVLDNKTDTNEIFVSTVGAVQDAMFANYEERVTKNPDVVAKRCSYNPTKLGVTANDWTAIIEAFPSKKKVAEPAPAVEAEAVTVTEVDEAVTAIVIDPAAVEVPNLDGSLEDEVADGEAEALADLGF